MSRTAPDGNTRVCISPSKMFNEAEHYSGNSPNQNSFQPIRGLCGNVSFHREFWLGLHQSYYSEQKMFIITKMLLKKNKCTFYLGVAVRRRRKVRHLRIGVYSSPQYSVTSFFFNVPLNKYQTCFFLNSTTKTNTYSTKLKAFPK